METIIKTYKNFGPLSELCKMSEVVLRNFMTNETLMSGLVEHGIYEAIFHQISKSEAPSILGEDSLLFLIIGKFIFDFYRFSTPINETRSPKG